MNKWRFDDSTESVYRYSREHAAYIYHCSYVAIAIKHTDTESAKERKANDE